MVKELEVGKELSEIADLIAKVIVEIKAKKELAVIAAECLPDLMAAVQGYELLADEAKTVGIDSALYAVSSIVKALK